MNRQFIINIWSKCLRASHGNSECKRTEIQYVGRTLYARFDPTGNLYNVDKWKKAKNG